MTARSGIWLIDVRPERLFWEENLESFAAEVAVACGWGYVVAAGWCEYAWAALDVFSSQRGQLADPLVMIRCGRGPGNSSPNTTQTPPR